MRNYVVHIYVQGPDGTPHKRSKELHVSGVGHEEVRQEVKALLEKEGLGKIVRSINFTPDGKVLVYCGEKPQRPPEKPGHTPTWRRPAGPPRS